MSVRLIVDSASDISALYAEEKNMVMIPMKLTMGGEEWIDGQTLSTKEFYDRLNPREALPKTSMINSFEYEQVFRQLQESGDEGIVITLSEKLSGTCQAARVAAAEFPNIHVVDSLQVTISLQILILYAQKLIDEGMSAAQVVEACEAVKGRIRLVALVDTLEYLKKGGRISPAIAAVGGLLKIKPVLEMKDGELSMAGKARGTHAGNNLLTEKVQEAGGIDFDMPIALGYSGNDDSMLRAYIDGSRRLWEGKVEELPICQIGCTIGTHAGPGAVAVGFFAKEN